MIIALLLNLPSSSVEKVIAANGPSPAWVDADTWHVYCEAGARPGVSMLISAVVEFNAMSSPSDCTHNTEYATMTPFLCSGLGSVQESRALLEVIDVAWRLVGGPDGTVKRKTFLGVTVYIQWSFCIGWEYSYVAKWIRQKQFANSVTK